MKKSTALKSICLLSFCFLLFQIISINWIFNKDSKTVKSRAENFLRECQRLNIRIFLLDLNILSQSTISEDTGKLLDNREYLQFGLLESNCPADIKKIFGEFEDSGCKVLIATKSDSKQDETSHIFLLHEDIKIHVVIFLKGKKDFLWTAAASETIQSKLPKDLQDKSFVKDSYLFKRFELRELHNILVPDRPVNFVHSLPYSRFIECNQTRARIFKDKYPQDDNEEARTFQRKARQIIARAKQYLDDLGIRFWLSSGTCLGWYRQCDIITYSKDVDFGIWIKDYKPQLIPVFEHGGFFLKHVFGKVSDSYELSFQAGDIKLDMFFFYEDETSMWNGGTHHETGQKYKTSKKASESYELSFQAGDIKLDLFFFYEDERSMWNGGTHHETGQKYKYIFPKFSLCWTEFLDMYVRVPCPAQPYIEANYGTNWMEPVKQWEWNKSPPNVRENGYWEKSEWPEVIQVF